MTQLWSETCYRPFKKLNKNPRSLGLIGLSLLPMPAIAGLADEEATAVNLLSVMRSVVEASGTEGTVIAVGSDGRRVAGEGICNGLMTPANLGSSRAGGCSSAGTFEADAAGTFDVGAVLLKRLSSDAWRSDEGVEVGGDLIVVSGEVIVADRAASNVGSTETGCVVFMLELRDRLGAVPNNERSACF